METVDVRGSKWPRGRVICAARRRRQRTIPAIGAPRSYAFIQLFVFLRNRKMFIFIAVLAKCSNCLGARYKTTANGVLRVKISIF